MRPGPHVAAKIQVASAPALGSGKPDDKVQVFGDEADASRQEQQGEEMRLNDHPGWH